MIFYPPANITSRDFTKPAIFLAGSIEMGKAEDWQTPYGEKFLALGFEVFNPRRQDWNPDWIQSFENPHFYQQVDWELNALEKSKYIIMRLSGGTLSPISLLELGRKGNVDMVCKRWNIPQFSSLDAVVAHLEKEITLEKIGSHLWMFPRFMRRWLAGFGLHFKRTKSITWKQK